MPKCIALIGFGAIGQQVQHVLANDNDVRVKQVLVRPERQAVLQQQLGDAADVVTALSELDDDIDLVLECAGHQAVRAFGSKVLKAGFDLGIMSAGVLADHTVQEALGAASAHTGAQAIVLPGAIGGTDAIAAAGQENLSTVTYIGRKSPLSWTGTPAEKTHDLARLSTATEIFNGSAREAAQAFPKNANVVATVALAGIGFDETRVSLIADPDAAANSHQITAQGPLLDFSFTTQGRPMPSNPKTSALTAMSAVRTLRNRARWCVI